MNENSIKRTFAKYVSLNIIGMIGLSCYILADTFFVARGVGANGLTALNLAIPIYSFIHGTGLMIGVGGATRFAISKAKTTSLSSSLTPFMQSLYFGACAAFIFVVVGIFFTEQLAKILGADGETLQNAAVYLRTLLLFAPMFLANNIVICFTRNDNAPKLASIAMLVGSFSNIVLDYVFIFPLSMGMFGAALATGIAPVISLMVLSLHFIKRKNTFHIAKCKASIKALKDILSLGISALITEFSSGIVIIVFNIIILSLEGNTGVAAYGIIANIALVIMSVFTGVAQGMQPILSRFHAQKRAADIKKVLRYGFITALLFAVMAYLVSAIFAKPIVEAFNKDENLRLAQIAVNGIYIYFTAFIFVGINILAATYFSAVDNPKNAFIISVLRGFAVIIPMAFILSALFGLNGVWIAMTCSEFIVLIVSVRMMRKIK